MDDPKPIPSSADRAKFRQALQDSAGMLFHPCTGLPLQSSPVSLIYAFTSSDFLYCNRSILVTVLFFLNIF